MANRQAATPPEVLEQARQLVAQMRSVQLATIGEDQTPHASYAPFVHVDGALFIYISRLAQHVRNLHSRPMLGALLIRDEAASEEIFARPRLSLECSVTELERDGRVFAAVLDEFEARFGQTAATVRELSDFSLFRLNPHAARFVGGFARAVDLGDDAIVSIFGASRSDEKE